MEWSLQLFLGWELFMKITEVLRRIPKSRWAVVVDAGSISAEFGVSLLHRLTGLEPGQPLRKCSHLVITDTGPLTARSAYGPLVDADGTPRSVRGLSFADAFANECDQFNVNRAQIFMLGHTVRDDKPFAVHARVAGSEVRAHVLLQSPPAALHHELFAALGARWVEGRAQTPFCLRRCRVGLEANVTTDSLLEVAQIFGRLLLNGFEIDAPLESALIAAGAERVRRAEEREELAIDDAVTSDHASLRSMRFTPPVDAPGSEVPHLAPVAIVHNVLDARACSASAGLMRCLLDDARFAGLWPDTPDGPVSPLTSGLFLLGHRDEGALRALEAFQLDSGYALRREPSEPETAHWSDVDYGITALVAAANRRHQRPVGAHVRSFLKRGVATRSSQFVTNPYVIDWWLAMALDDDLVRRRLASEILDSMRHDGTFGSFDAILSTACALLALRELGVAGRTTRVARLALCQMLSDGGRSDEVRATLLMRSFEPHADALAVRVHGELHPLSMSRGQRWVDVGERRLLVAGYGLGQHALHALGLAAIGQGQGAYDSDRLTYGERENSPHPRYTCNDAFDYAARVGLSALARQTKVARDAG